MRCVPRVAMLLFVCLLGGNALRAQVDAKPDEIPLEKCDVLPVVVVTIAGTEMRFLLDTGATTMLNLGSFGTGRSKEIEVSSWKGTAETSAKEVHLAELSLGNHQLRDLRLPAIDLSPLTKACGKKIDGIFGVDLMDRMGVTINLKRRVASMEPDATDARRLYDLMEGSMFKCAVAFEQGDAKVLAECFDEEIVFYTPDGEYRGRKEVLAYLQGRYMEYAPNLHYRMTLKDVKAFGDALWYSYDYTIDSPKEHQQGHGMSMCQREQGTWRILNLHNSLRDADTANSGAGKNSN